MDAELTRSDPMLKRAKFDTWPRESCTYNRKKLTNWVYLVYTYASVLVNIFDKSG